MHLHYITFTFRIDWSFLFLAFFNGLIELYFIPVASHVVPVTNYKKIVTTALPTLCRFYPNCSNTLCEFYHPKPCKYGKSCTNKVECNFYHFDLPAPPNNASMPSKNKMKWVASAVWSFISKFQRSFLLYSPLWRLTDCCCWHLKVWMHLKFEKRMKKNAITWRIFCVVSLTSEF